MISTFNPVKDVHIQSTELEDQLVEKLSRKKNGGQDQKDNLPR